MIQPDPNKVFSWIIPHMVETPEYINVAAFDFWSASLDESARANGLPALGLTAIPRYRQGWCCVSRARSGGMALDQRAKKKSWHSRKARQWP
jgi:hypothetical protein